MVVVVIAGVVDVVVVNAVLHRRALCSLHVLHPSSYLSDICLLHVLLTLSDKQAMFEERRKTYP